MSNSQKIGIFLLIAFSIAFAFFIYQANTHRTDLLTIDLDKDWVKINSSVDTWRHPIGLFSPNTEHTTRDVKGFFLGDYSIPSSKENFVRGGGHLTTKDDLRFVLNGEESKILVIRMALEFIESKELILGSIENKLGEGELLTVEGTYGNSIDTENYLWRNYFGDQSLFLSIRKNFVEDALRPKEFRGKQLELYSCVVFLVENKAHLRVNPDKYNVKVFDYLLETFSL